MIRLPADVKTALQQRGTCAEPELVVRALNSVGGDLGEAYLFTNRTSLYIFSRKVGSKYEEICLPLAGLRDVRLSEDRPFAYLSFAHGDRTFGLKFSGMDMEHLKALNVALAGAEEPHTKNFRSKTSPPTLPPEAFERALMEDSEADVELTPVIGFCAAVYALMQVDSSVDDAELDLLNQMINHPPTVLKGLDALRRLGPVELFDRLNKLMTEPQKLCLMANLVEMSMVDGLVRGQERQMLRQIRDAIGIDNDNYDAIFEILMIKNNRSVFEIRESSQP